MAETPTVVGIAITPKVMGIAESRDAVNVTVETGL